MSTGLTTCPGDIFEHTAIKDELLFGNHVFKFTCIKLGKDLLH
jgi:hypothetical protein